MVVTVAAVVEVFHLVDGIPGERRRSGGHGPALSQGEVFVSLRAEDFQLVDSRLRTASRFVDGHAYELGQLRRKDGRFRRLDRFRRRNPSEFLRELVSHRSRLGPVSLRQADLHDQKEA